MKDFLVFTGVGKDNRFKSWASESQVYDRAINYYQNDPVRKNELLDINAEHFSNVKGEIWLVFCQLYEQFKDYKYVLIVDSDVELDKVNLEETLLRARENNWSACSWSRSLKDQTKNKHASKYFTKGAGTRETNFIEMIFMLIRQDLLEATVKKWATLDLKYAFGVDLVLANVARENDMQPFHLIDDYCFYNPQDDEKEDNQREIDIELKNKTKDRSKAFKEATKDYKQWFEINWETAYVR